MPEAVRGGNARVASPCICESKLLTNSGFNAGSRSLLQAVMQRELNRNPTSNQAQLFLVAMSGDMRGVRAELT